MVFDDGSSIYPVSTHRAISRDNIGKEAPFCQLQENVDIQTMRSTRSLIHPMQCNKVSKHRGIRI